MQISVCNRISNENGEKSIASWLSNSHAPNHRIPKDHPNMRLKSRKPIWKDEGLLSPAFSLGITETQRTKWLMNSQDQKRNEINPRDPKPEMQRSRKQWWRLNHIGSSHSRC